MDTDDDWSKEFADSPFSRVCNTARVDLFPYDFGILLGLTSEGVPLLVRPGGDSVLSRGSSRVLPFLA